MPELPEALTRKIGPLPVWGWGAVVVAGVVAASYLRGGAGNGGTVLGTVTDAASGAEDAFGGGTAGGGDGVTQTPVGSGATGTVGGNGTTRTILSVRGRLPFQRSGALGTVAGHIPADAGRFYVQRVKLGGNWYYRIIGRVGPNGTLTSSGRNGQLIRDRAELRKLFAISQTQATQAA